MSAPSFARSRLAQYHRRAGVLDDEALGSIPFLVRYGGATQPIFDRFHRADATHGRGHGLGLYIAAALSRLHGGTLAARSELGKGSTFTLRLPLAR